jgi:hypothetical protein
MASYSRGESCEHGADAKGRQRTKAHPSYHNMALFLWGRCAPLYEQVGNFLHGMAVKSGFVHVMKAPYGRTCRGVVFFMYGA